MGFFWSIVHEVFGKTTFNISKSEKKQDYIEIISSFLPSVCS